MAKQKKNSNYVTEKNIEKQEAKEEEKRKEQQTKIIKRVAIISGSVVGAIALILLLVFILDVPTASAHATFNLDNGESIHIELYGNAAPETVEHFLWLCEDKDYYGRTYFEDMYVHTFLNGLLYVGSERADIEDGEVLRGEFSKNSFYNRIKMTEGTVCMARGEDYDSAYGQFFILTKDAPSLMGEYAAFGKVTNMDEVKALIESLEVDENGEIIGAPKIVSVNVHEAHH